MKAEFKTIHGNHYETPDNIFNTINKEFNFKFDLASDGINNKLPNFFTEKEDALKQDWHKIKGWLWLNPPYSPLKPWIIKAQNEAKLGAKIVMLVPPLISSSYFSKFLPKEIRIINGRLAFLLNKKPMKQNTKDSCLLIYDGEVNQTKLVFINRNTISGVE